MGIALEGLHLMDKPRRINFDKLLSKKMNDVINEHVAEPLYREDSEFLRPRRVDVLGVEPNPLVEVRPTPLPQL